MTLDETSVITYFVVRAICLNQVGEEVHRDLGMVRGMSDNGRLGWTRFAAEHFKTLDEARRWAKTPYAYSVHDGHYKGGPVKICETTVRTVTDTIYREHDV